MYGVRCAMFSVQIFVYVQCVCTVCIVVTTAVVYTRVLIQVVFHISPFPLPLFLSITPPQRCMDIVGDVLTDAGVAATEVDEVIPVGGATRMPLLRTMLEEMFVGTELCTSMNPDEVVAEGAAVRAAVLCGVEDEILKDVLMLDVVPQAFGLGAADGTFETLIERNSRIPAKATRTFRTFEDGQRGVTVDVYEGEAATVDGNRKLGSFDFFIPREDRGKAGEVEVEVTFSFDESGLLRVSTATESERLFGEGGKDGSKAGAASLMSSMWLSFYLVLLVALWMWARLHFADFHKEYAANQTEGGAASILP